MASICLGGVAVVQLAALWAGFRELSLVREIDSTGGLGVTDADINGVDNLMIATSLTMIIALLVAGVVFLDWFWRMRVNAEILAPDGHERRRPWTFWGWFCPIVNLWFPRQIAGGIQNASTGESPRSEALMNWWWGLFLLMGFSDRIDATVYANADSLVELETSLAVSAGVAGITVVAAIVAIMFVRRQTAMQEDAVHRRLTAAA